MRKQILIFIFVCTWLFWSFGPQAQTNLSGLVTPATTNSAAISLASATVTQLIPAVTGQKITITGYGITIGTTLASANTVQLVYGTGTNCASGQTVITGGVSGGTIASLTGDNLPTLFSDPQIYQIPASQAVCVITTGTQAVSGGLSYGTSF